MNLTLSTFVNKFETTCGIDSPEECLNPQHYLDFKQEISYQYNSTGYRDTDWPDNLTDQVWCIGDSFTVGLGQPFNEIWPQVVARELDTRTINISMNGASNDWIARRAEYILQNYNPKAVLILWSYLHRREDPDSSKIDEDRIKHYDIDDSDDLRNFEKNLHKVMAADVNSCTVHSFIPRAHSIDYLRYFNLFRKSEPNIANQILHDILEINECRFFQSVDLVDRARDFHHYGVNTARLVAENYIGKIKPNISPKWGCNDK